MALTGSPDLKLKLNLGGLGYELIGGTSQISKVYSSKHRIRSSPAFGQDILYSKR